MAKKKTIKQRLIDRLNKGFGFNIPYDITCICRQSRGCRKYMGVWSWVMFNHSLEIGSSNTMTECLKMKRWVIDENGEIFNAPTDYELEPTDLLEKID